MLISSWLKTFRNRLQSRPRRIARRVQRASRQAEHLESKTLLTSPMFQGAMLPGGTAFPENAVLQTTPAQVTLQFDATQVMDLSTVNATTLVVDAAGGDATFDTADDLSITLTGFGGNPLPNQNLVYFQFGQQLLTDQYRLTMEGDGLDADGSAVAAMANAGGEAINNGADQTFFFSVDLPDPTLIAVLPNEGTFINVDPALPTTTLDVPPNELTLQFNPGQIIDPATVNVNTIQVQRAGHDGQFAEANEVPVTIGYVGIGDTPEEVIVRFAENLVDDTYRITLDGSGSAPLANVQGEVFNGGQDFSFDLTLDLGARVVAVDPQPVTRMPDGSLSQNRNQIVVYFNEDQLDPVAAINTDFYQLIFTNDTVSNADDVHHSPTVVVYDSVTNTATLTFAGDIDLLNNPGLPSSGTYRLRIGNDEVKPLAPTQLIPGTDPGSSFDTANATLGDISDPVANSQIIDSSIDPQLFPFEFPGANDEPGHRQIEVETHLNGGADTGASGISKINYNFKIDYGFDPQGNALSNLITENEKQRAREIFDLYSNLLGIDFTETDSSGLTIVTGDLRALDPAIPTGPGGVAGLAGGTMAIMDMAENWTDNTGGSWFDVAIHEIGHLLGLGHSYDLPPETIQGADGGINAGRDVFVEPSFPGAADIIHGRHLHRLDSIDIDMYEFDVINAGLFSAEVMAERLADSSTLDSVLRLYRENPDGSRELIAQNDDYFSEDSFIELSLEPGHYFLGVSSTGNDAYDPTIANTGLNGSSDGPYQIRTNFRPNVDNTIIDSTGVAFDGDSDGVAGGVYNFWFRAAATVDTLFVDKAAASHLLTAIDSTQTDLPFQHVTTFSVGDGILIDSEVMTITAINTTTNVVTVTRGVPAAHSLGSVIRNTASDGQLLTPFGVIDDAIQASGPGDIIRIVGNGGLDGMESTIDDNLSYQIGFDNNNQILEDGRELEVPQGVTVMIDAGAVFKLQKSRVGVGSSSSIVDRSRGALQVLGTPGRDVIFTSWLDESIGTDTSLGTPTSPDIGNWGGLVFRNDTDRAQNRFNYQTEGIFLNYVAHSDIRYGGGQVVVDNTLQTVNPIHITRAQPTIVHNRITMNEDSAMSADPDSFEEVTFNTPRYQGGLTAFTSDYKRVGPDIYGNTLLDNSTNGLFVRVQTSAGADTLKLTVPGRFDDLDIVHVVAQNLEIQGTPGGAFREQTAPQVTITAVTGSGTGTLVPGESFSYRVTFVDENGFESPASVATPTVVVLPGNSGMLLTQLPVATGVYTGRRIYRSQDGGAGTYDLIAELDKSATSYQDVGGDLGRTLNSVAPRNRARIDASLAIDAGVIVKLEGSRIQTGFGAQLIAEGQAGREIIFTSRLDDKYGAGGTFDTNDDGDLVGRLQTLFFDDFSSGTLDPLRWSTADTSADGQAINSDGFNEPSEPLSLNMFSDASVNASLRRVQSETIDLSGEVRATLEFSFQRTGGGESPEAGDDLFVEFRDAAGNWVEIDRQLGTGPDMVNFERIVVDLPAIALHANFAFRFRHSGVDVSAVDGDDYFIDDVLIRQGRTAAAPEAGDWGGIYIGHTGSISVDQALITHAGGVIPLESDFAGFNPIEIHQAKGRIRNTVFENNAEGLGGTAPGNRFDLLPHSTGTIFVRGSQPVIIDNIFRDNSGPVININTNALNSDIVTDPGRSTGAVDRQAGYIDNQGPLVRDNTLGRNEINGMLVRGETLTTQSVWDDTDMVHVLQNEVYIPDLHTSGGLRLESSPAESLVIKLSGANSGFSASGEPLDIVDRIGGMLHVIGQPGQPVVMTSLADDTVGAGFDLEGFPLTDTNNDGDASDPAAAPNRWRGISIEEYAHDRNIGVYVESEVADAAIPDSNSITPEVVGTLAKDEKSGDETLRLGFEIHGTIDNPGDIDVYSISAVAGSQLWIDIDKSTQALDSVVELLDASGQVLALSDNTLNEKVGGAWTVVSNNGTQAFPLDYSQYNSDDLFTLNQRDAGLRIVLPGTAGLRTEYSVRVRSSNIDSTDGLADRTDLEDPALVDNGLTQGAYQLQLRLQELDEFPGTTVQFADIRYAATGIDITGLPIHSPLTGESEEVEGSNTNLGNLMDTDRAALAVRGDIVSSADVDYYTFEVNYESTQQIGGVSLSGPHVPVTFDLDYADGFGRGDLTMAVYDNAGRLILVGRDSNVADDRHHSPDDSPVLSDLTRGTVGAFDPFIGSVELPGGSYTLAVTNNRQLPSGLDQFFDSSSSATALRVEPINSVERIAEERFGSGTDTFTSASEPTTDLFTVSGGVIDPSHIVPFNLADVVLFVSSGFGVFDGTEETTIRTVNPFTGYQDTLLGEFGPSIGDIAMRPDGQLYAMTTGPQGTGAPNAGNVGHYLEIDTGTAAVNDLGDDGITANLSNNGAPPDAVAYGNAHFVFDAMMFSGTSDSGRYAIGTRVDPLALPNNTSKVNQYDENVLYNFLSQGSAVDGAGGDRTGFARAFSGAGTTQREIGQVNTIGDANVTGMARLNDGSDETYIVDENGMLYSLSLFSATATFIADLGVIDAAGLAAGPDEVEGGAFGDVLFTIDTGGELFAFDTTGVPQPIFVDAQTSVSTGTTAVNGLAFSTLDRNLWGLTNHRGTDAGHGVETRFDDSILNIRQEGGTSLYFGNTRSTADSGNQNNLTTGEINDVNFPGGAHGSAVSNTFSLVGYDEDDKPVLYFNYFLETENAEYDYGYGPILDDLMRDSFRVFVGDESGEWNLISTNNGLQLSIRADEFDYGPDGTSTAAPVTQNFPDVVETFDTGEWRQARVDLSNFAGRDNLRLRFDFSTAGSQDIGNLNTRGFELYALSADKLSDGDTFIIDGTSFEFEMGTHMTVPSGAAALGESFDLYAETFTYVLVSTGPNEIAVTAAMTAKEVADATVAAINANPNLTGISIDLPGGAMAEGESFTVDGETFTFTANPLLPNDILADPAAVPPDTADVLVSRAVISINNVLGAGTAVANGASIDLPTTTSVDSYGGTLDLSGTAMVSDLEGETFTVRGETFTFTATPLPATNDINISGGPTLSDLTATTIAEINAVIGAGTALAHDLGAPNRISVPDLPLAADAFTIGGTLDLSSVAVVGDLELQAFRVLGQTFTFTATPVVGQNDIDISAAATVADATAAAIGVINTTLGAGTALAHDAAAPNRLTVPNLPTAGDSFVLSNDLTIPAELGGNLEGESFFAFGQIFTFTDTPVAATDIQINPADTGDTIATAAAAIINGVVGGGDRASAAGAGGVLQLNAFDSRFGETVQLPNGAAVLGDSLTIDGITFDFVTTPSFFPPNPNPEIIVAAGNSSTFVAFLTASEINAQFGVGTAVRDGDKLLLTTGTVTSEIGATSTGAIAITGAGTTLTFAGTGATVIGEILSVGGMQYTFIDTTGGGVPGASEIGVLPADAADVVAAAAQTVLDGDFPGDVAVLTNVITLANGLTAEDNILLDATNVPVGLTFGTEVNADAVGTPLVIDAADTTLVDSPLDPATSPLSASNANRVTVFSATETDMTSMSAVLTLAGGAGVTVGNTAVVLSDVNATANEVAVEIRQALADVFSPIGGGPIGDITNIKGAENLIQVIGHTVTSPGPLGLTGRSADINSGNVGELPGDFFGAYEAGYRHTGASETSDTTMRPGSLRGMDNAVEGIHVDDIIIGFAERGEMVINAPAGTGFTQNLDVLNGNYPTGQTWLGIDVGEYDVEIRRANDYGETQAVSPTNGLYRSIDTNDREAQLVSVTLPSLSEVVPHASTVTVSDGVDSVTFQFLDQNETTIPGSGLFPILFDPLTDEPYTLAAELRDAINQPIVQGILDVKAALSDGTDSGTASTSSTVHLTGNATVTGSNEAIVATLSIGAVTVSPLGSSFSTSDGVETLGAPLPGTAILVDGTPFFFVDGAVTPMPTPTQIAVLVTDTAVQVAAKAAVVLDAFFPAAVSSSANIVNLPTGIIVEDFDSFGDQNHHRDQGQLIIHSSFVTDSSNFGISVDAGVRENNTRPRPGSVRNLQVLNSSRLATSVVITNNVVAGNISGGIQFSGDQTNNPSGIVPYGRIVNNTIVGVGTGTGILVTQSASPTLMNNIVADFNTGISVDASSLAAGTTIGSTLYRIPAPNQPTAGIGLGTFPLQLSAADPLFVDQVNRNYYLAPLSSAIDSGLETLGDRPALVSVKGPLGLGTSPILSPKLDVYGQLRGDDGDAPNTSGQGGNVFIDRGAIDRVDFFRPRASLVSPLDQSLVTPVDLDPALDRVSISGPDLVREFTIKLTDEGIGIDTINVVSEQFVLLQEGVPLLEGVSYLWRYNSSTGDVTFQSPTAFTTDRSYEIRVKNTAAVVNDPNDIDGVKDLAGNFLVPNQIDGTTRFFISLSDGVNDAPINAVPGDQTTPEDTVFTFASGTPDAISVSDSDAHLGNNELTVTLLADHGAVPVITVGPSQDTLRFPAATTLVGQTVDIRDQRTADTTTTFTFVDAAPADNTEIQIDPAVDDATAVASAVAAAVSAALPAAPAAAPAGDTVTLVAGVTAEGLYFTSSAIGVAGADQITVLDAATVVGEQLTINSPTLGSVIFTYVDINVVTSPARNEIGVDANAGTANDVAAATVAAINDVKMFGAGASSATLAVIDLTGGLSASDSDGTSIQVNGLVITVPDGATVIGEEINVDGTIFRYVDAAIVVGPTTTEIAVDVTDLAAQVAVATQLVLNAHGAVVGTASASVDTVSLDAGTVATVVPLTLAGSRLTMPAGAAVIGDHIAVGGSVFTFVDAAVVTAPTATEIAVNAGDSPTDVATTTATVLNTAFPGSAGSAMDVVTVDGVAVSGATPAAGQAVVTISGDVSLVNQALGDLPFLPATDYFGPALLTVYSEDFGQFTHDPVGRIHESDLDVVAFDVTPVNDAPRIGMIADDAVDEDVDVVMPVGNDEHEVIVPGVADGPINEDEAIVVTAALNVTTNIAMPNGANAMGQSLTINGTVFAYVATAPSGLTEIQVSNGDSSQQVAAATEAALNAFPALSAISIRSAFNFVSLSLNSANITASSSDFAISDHDALLSVVNPVVNDVLKYTTALNAFGMVDVVVTVTDAGLDGILFNGDDAQVSDTFTITVRPINDDPTLDAITDISVSEDTDTTPADGNNDEQNVSLTGITPGAGNEVEDVVVTAALADTTLIAFARGANIIGETLTVNGTTFSFVDDDTAPIAADQIRVKMSDSTIKVATAAKDAINSVFVATAVQTQTVGLEQLNSIAVSFDDSLVTASGEMAVSNQDDLITGLAVDYTPGANTAQLRYTPGDNQFGGTVEVTVEIEDAGIDGLISTDRNNVDNQLKNNVTTQTFLITVVPVNDVPTLPALADQVLLENVANTQTVALTPVSAGAPNELEDVNAGATTLESTTNVVMAAAANVIGETLEIDGTVFTYVTATGTATDIVVAAGDSAITVATKTAAAVNAQGGIDIARATDNFVALDVDSSLVTGSSTEAFAVSGQNDLITGFNLNGVTNELEYEVVPEAFGEATITITLMDAGIDGLFGDPVTAPAEAADNLSVDRAFRITVTPVNDAPTMDTVDPQTVNEDATEQSVDLTGISAGPLNELENTRFLPATIANTRSVAVAAGSRIIGQKLTVDSRDFEYVSGSPVGDQIQVSAGSSSQQVATATAARLDFVLAPATPIVATDNTITTDLSVTVPVASADHFEVMEAADIIASSRFVYTSRDATGTFFYTPSAVNFGQVTVTLTVEDAGTDGLFEDDPLTTTRDESADNVSTDRTFTITVTPDNDTPTLNPLLNLDIPVSEAPFTVDLSGITSGADNELEDLRVTATSSNTALIPDPAVTYTSDQTTGSIQISPVAGVSGLAIVTVTIEDAGVDGLFGDPVTAPAEAADNRTFSREFRIATPPVIQTPMGVITDTTPLITWVDFSTASAYEVQLTNVTENVPVDLGTGLTAVQSFQITTPLTLGDYEVQVRSIDASGDPGLWSAPVEFTVAIAPSNVNPTEDRLPDSTPTFSWSPVPGADAYSLQIVDDTTSSVVFTSSNFIATTLTVPNTNALPLGRYRYTITAHNNPAGMGSVVSASTERMLTISTPPEVLLPFVAIYDTTPTITWTTPVGEVVSDIEVFNVTTDSIQFTQIDVAGGSFTVPDGSELMPGEYRVRARSYGDAGRTLDSDWSTHHVFQIGAVPVLLGPSEGLSGSGGNVSRTASAKPTLTWNGSLDGESYKVWVSDLITGQAIYIVDGLTSAGYTPPADLPVGNYRYWAQASTGTGERSDWSDSYDFSVVTAPSIDPFGPSILDRTPTITWNDQDRVATWQVWVNKTDEVPAVVQYVENGLTSPEFTVPDDMVNGVYTVWVRGFTDTVTTEWSPGFEFEVGGRPVVVNPSSTTDTTPTLLWLPVEGAAGYVVYLAAADDVPNPILNESGLGATSITLTEELTPGIYKFWVRGIEADGTLTPWSLNSQASFTVRAVAVPVLNDVPDGSDSTPTITWSNASGAARYEIFISLRATPTLPVLRVNNLTDTTFTPATPLALGNYRVWVRSISTNNQVSDWSVPDSFTIATNEPGREDRRSTVQLVSLNAAATTWEPEDVTVSQLSIGLAPEGGHPIEETTRHSVVAAPAESLTAAIALESSAQQLKELQSGDVLMAAWDEAIWKEESAETPTAEHNDPSPGPKQTAATGWLAGLAAFTPALFRKRRKNRKS